MGFVQLVLAFFIALAAVLAYVRFRRASRIPLPPGPPGEPFLGHLRIIPASNPEQAYRNWAREFNSDVIHLNVLNQEIIVLNSAKAAVDLLDKRGANYRDRPNFTLFETMGLTYTLPFLGWGPQFQKHRKLLQGYFTKHNVQAFRELQVSEARILVKNLIEQPEAYRNHILRFASALVMGIAFGHRITSNSDRFIQIGADASYAISHAGAPGGSAIDFFPLLRHLPDWLPRPTSLKVARKWRWAIDQLYGVPFASVQEQMRQGTAPSSFILPLLEGINAGAEKGIVPDIKSADIKGAGGTIYIAGQDSTSATLAMFLLNMVLSPEVQLKAQNELDSIIGFDRLPTVEDRPSLPYIERVMQETFRWHPVVPLGIPHKSLDNDIYQGMFIPKGSIVFANAWSMCHDEAIYKDPSLYNPDRYAPISEGGNGEPLPIGHFGFGRRICVGRHLAESSVWIAFATILATLTIGKEIGPDGKEISPNLAFSAGLSSHPEPFKCTIRPRSKHAEELVMSTVAAATG
ncbi:hypothetical protein BS47DRAFT_1348721 [Hydnum rufescens UP504]|uniref:Cytochrome P450 n=1 Tax=Hydnum rufescens UP504 TaxID=1448309 RepID=A0A9P6DPC2_9AGAM|nr:hypothetical protein BS47DRAFT_1348721 [Hydnum rufescens UP504]